MFLVQQYALVVLINVHSMHSNTQFKSIFLSSLFTVSIFINLGVSMLWEECWVQTVIFYYIFFLSLSFHLLNSTKFLQCRPIRSKWAHHWLWSLQCTQKIKIRNFFQKPWTWNGLGDVSLERSGIRSKWFSNEFRYYWSVGNFGSAICAWSFRSIRAVGNHHLPWLCLMNVHSLTAICTFYVNFCMDRVC